LDSLYGELLRALLVFGGVLLLLYGTVRYLRGRWHPGTGTGGLELVGSLYLGPRARLVLIRFAGTEYLLGVSEQQVTLLASAPPAEPGLSGGETP